MPPGTPSPGSRPVSGRGGERRFAFGENWSRLLPELDRERLAEAQKSLCHMYGLPTLEGLTFLDVGCGSGLFSLAARLLGARVHSFDYDPDSVACAQSLRETHLPDDPGWKIEPGDATDPMYMDGLPRFDLVYAWGVLHHTGAMWKALDLTSRRVAPGGKLFIAIYNDQGWASRVWRAVKWTYVTLPRPLRWMVVVPSFLRLWGPTMLRDLLAGRPLATWKGYRGHRGMDARRDLIDWVGGYPFEVAGIKELAVFHRTRGLELLRSKGTDGGLGCNELVFRRNG